MDTIINDLVIAYNSGWLAFGYLIYMVGAKLFLAVTTTPAEGTFYSHVYKAIETSVLILGKAKQQPAGK